MESAKSHENKLRLRAYVISFFISAILLFVKLFAYKKTGSQAVLSDALESIINVVTPIFGFLVILFSSKPADRDHPYGHGKIEFFSSAFEGGLIIFAAIMIVAAAVNSFAQGIKVEDLGIGLLLVMGAGVVNLFLGVFVLKSGKTYNSIALTANGRHILADAWTTAGVLIGLLLVRSTGIVWLDPLTALIVGILLGIDGFRLVRKSAAGLLDEEDESILKTIAGLFTRHRIPGIIHIHHTRVIRSGRYHHIDAHVVVPEFWDVTTAHKKTAAFEKSVISDYPVEGEIHFHLDPCRRAYCENCVVERCPIRGSQFREYLPFTIDSLIDPEEPEAHRQKRHPNS